MSIITHWFEIVCYFWCVLFVQEYQTDPLYMEMMRTDQFVDRKYKHG